LGSLLPEALPQALTASGRYLLPGSPNARGREFERLAAIVLARSGIAMPVCGSVACRGDIPGQWDGVVIYRGSYFLLEAKAYSDPMSSIPKLEKRISECSAFGVKGIILVTLAGASENLFGGSEVVHLPFDSIAPPPRIGTLVTPAGFSATAEERGLRFGRGLVSTVSCRFSLQGTHFVTCSPTDFKFIHRASLYASQGRDVGSGSLPPLAPPVDGFGRLWEVEDLLSGLYSPPLELLREVFALPMDLGLLAQMPARLRGNITRVLTHGGRVAMPETPEEARRNCESFPPFVMWREARARAGDRNGAIELLRERWLPLGVHGSFLYNPNKATACDRYLTACGVNQS
jgi:hypothetical protein